jgi:hypothetical protein
MDVFGGDQTATGLPPVMPTVFFIANSFGQYVDVSEKYLRRLCHPLGDKQ